MSRTTILLAVLIFLFAGLLISLGMGVYVRTTSIAVTIVYAYDASDEERQRVTPEEVARTEGILKQRIRIFGGEAQVLRGQVKPIENGKFEVALRMRKNTPDALTDVLIQSLAKSGAIELRLVAPDEHDNASVRSAQVNAPDKAANLNTGPNKRAPAERRAKGDRSTEDAEKMPNEDELEKLFFTEEYYDLDNPRGMKKKRTPLLVKRRPELVVRTLKSVDYRTEGLLRRPIITLQFNEDDSVAFEKISGANIGEQLAVVIGGEIKTAPVIKAAITGGRVEIRGIRVARTAKILADVLRAGGLPYPLRVVERREER